MGAENPRVAVGWSGLPPYGARLIRRFAEKCGVDVTVVATKAAVPFTTVEEELGRIPSWVDGKWCGNWADLGLAAPDVFVQCGWNVPVFNSLADEVRRSGGKVVLMVDNRFKASIRQYCGAVYFRFFLARKFSAVIVPGKSAWRLCRMLGFPAERIIKGQYGIDLSRYTGCPSILDRPRNLTFVGQLIRRKGFDTLIAAWKSIPADTRGEWRLLVCGVGCLQDLIIGVEGVDYVGFQQPAGVVSLYQRTRVLVLPSRDDHFPLVTLEAAACGCGLVLSDSVGTSIELARSQNLVATRVGEVRELRNAMVRFMGSGDDAWRTVEAESKAAASQFGLDRFADALRAYLNSNNSM